MRLNPLKAEAGLQKKKNAISERSFKETETELCIQKHSEDLCTRLRIFLAPEGDHFRTRLTHTIEVSQIARTIARGCGLNEDLAEGHSHGT